MENNGTEKKSFNFFGLILLVILIIGCVIGGYFVGVNVTKDEVKETEKDEVDDENTEPVVSGGINFDDYNGHIPSSPGPGIFVNAKKKTITVGNNSFDLVFFYYVGSHNVTSSDGVEEYCYDLHIDMYMDDYQIIKSEKVLESTNKELFNTVSSGTLLDTISIREFKDTISDEVYYLLDFGEFGIYNDIFEKRYIYLIDSKGNTLHKFNSWISSGVYEIYGTESMIGDRTAVLSENKEGMYKFYTHNLVDVHDDYIYYIAEGATCDSAAEYRFTIENGQIITEPSRVYISEQVEGAGQC